VKKNIVADDLIMGEAAAIGAAEAAHLAGVLMGWPFTGCVILFWWLAAVTLVVGLLIVRGRSGACRKRAKERRRKRLLSADGAEWAMGAVLGLLFLSQLIFVCLEDSSFRQGDMTIETVGSFLATDQIYRVNPMTGMPYAAGLPLRLEILCLPTLYGSLCRAAGLAPGLVIGRIVPAMTLASCYAAFTALAYSLFPEEAPEGGGRAEKGKTVRKKRLCFLIAVALLLWAGAYRYGMDGFDVLCCGWRGVSIRNGVLLPWLLSLCIRKKRLCILVCILAEGCIVWTFYGCGVCLFLALGMALAQLLWHNASSIAEKIRRKERAE